MPCAGVFPPLGARVVLQHPPLIGLLLGLEVIVAVAPNHSAHFSLGALVVPEKAPHLYLLHFTLKSTTQYATLYIPV